MKLEEIIEGLKSGNRRALARAITLVENESPEASMILKAVHRDTGDAHVVGVTGFPGVGKSTIVSKLTAEFRSREKKVGIIAVDPSSPFTGGALLGDRLRLDGLDVNKNLWLDQGVFFRSMGSRGMHGGIAKKTADVVKLLDAFGFDMILIETVGAGQSEVVIMEIADTVVVVLMPETGDEIQVNKAGILEIGDIYVINKADLDGAENVERWIKYMLSLDEEIVKEMTKMTHADEARLKERLRWKKPVLKTIAERGVGIKELADEIEKHGENLKKSGKLEEKRRERQKKEIVELVLAEFRKKVEAVVDRILNNDVDPYTAAEEVMREIAK